MSDDRKLETGRDWTQHGDTITGTGAARDVFRGIQADLNYFAIKVGFDTVKVDGVLGPKTLAAVQAVGAAVAKADAALAGTVLPAADLGDVATHAVSTRTWLESTARKALGIGDGLLRLSVGIEDIADLKDDLQAGFLAAANA